MLRGARRESSETGQVCALIAFAIGTISCRETVHGQMFGCRVEWLEGGGRNGGSGSTLGRVGVAFAALIVVLGVFVGNAGAGVLATIALGFEGPGNWFLAEGSGTLESNAAHAQGVSSLQVGGTYRRRLFNGKAIAGNLVPYAAAGEVVNVECEA
jgi:hypothetical protein